jgi:hypothetical protein
VLQKLLRQVFDVAPTSLERTTAVLAFEATFPDKREISLGIRQLRHNKNRVSGAFQNFLIEVL